MKGCKAVKIGGVLEFA